MWDTHGSEKSCSTWEDSQYVSDIQSHRHLGKYKQNVITQNFSNYTSLKSVVKTIPEVFIQ